LVQHDNLVSEQGYAMNQRLMIRFLLGLSLLEGGRVSCHTLGVLATQPASQSVTSVTAPCEPDAKECKDQIMALELQWEAQTWSSSSHIEISIQKLNKDRQNLPVPGAVNYYQGEATFGRKPKFRKILEKVSWKRFLWEFNLGGFAEMCFVDPGHFDSLNYDLQYSGDKMLLGRRCWVYRVTPKKHAKGWHFAGTIWVLPEELTIIRAKGAYQPMHKILWFLVEDHWFSFDSRRKEISPAKWVPDFTCTRVDVVASDFTKPAFQGRIRYVNRDEDKPSAASEGACGMGPVQFPTRATQPEASSRVDQK
jgi:hypothetical protein